MDSIDHDLVSDLWTCICLGKHDRLKKALKCNGASTTINQHHGSSRDWPLLRLAVFLDDAESTRLLLEAGADPNAYSGCSWATGNVYGVNFCKSRSEVCWSSFHESIF